MSKVQTMTEDGVELLVAVDVLLALYDQISVVSTYIAAARAEGRKRLTAAEWADIQQSQVDARADLVDAIEHADPQPSPTG